MRWLSASLVFFAACSSSSAPTSATSAGGSGGSGGSGGGSGAMPALQNAAILVPQGDDDVKDCRTQICRHNENTDLIRWNGAIFFVHRTALGQVLGPNSALHVYRSDDEGATFEQTAIIEAPQMPIDATDPATTGRDIRDPCFYVVGDQLYIKALTRTPTTQAKDAGVDTLTVTTSTSDGVTFSPLQIVAPPMWSFWRVKQYAGVYYAAAYHDGDTSTALFSSPDGVTWTLGATIFDDASETPLEPEIVFMPSGKMLVYGRVDGDAAHLLGDLDVHTKVCWSDPPYSSFDCSQQIDGQRLDGPVDFWLGNRLFIVARKHLGTSDKKRTSLFEVTGNLDGGPIDVVERIELPSAGDTAYAGVVQLRNGHWLATWYSSTLADDPPWATAMAGPTDIWRGEFVF